MKKVLITCVNYNSYQELNNYLASIEAAAKYAPDCRVEVLVADNSTEKQEIDTSSYSQILFTVYNLDNLGYLGGAQKAMSLYGDEKVKLFDFVIISNVDVILSETFFVELLAVDVTNVGWITPRIYTPKIKKDENPLMLHRPSKQKMEQLCRLYKCPWCYYFYANVVYKLRHKERKTILKSINDVHIIYAGQGSIMIFTQKMVVQSYPFLFPCFLYGEEIYFAEIVRRLSLKTIYVPAIYVENIANVSTGLLGNKKRCMYSVEALEEIIKRYF